MKPSPNFLIAVFAEQRAAGRASRLLLIVLSRHILSLLFLKVCRVLLIVHPRHSLSVLFLKMSRVLLIVLSRHILLCSVVGGVPGVANRTLPLVYLFCSWSGLGRWIFRISSSSKWRRKQPTTATTTKGSTRMVHWESALQTNYFSVPHLLVLHL